MRMHVNQPGRCAQVRWGQQNPSALEKRLPWTRDTSRSESSALENDKGYSETWGKGPALTPQRPVKELRSEPVTRGWALLEAGG